MLVVLTTLLFGATPAWGASGTDLLHGANDPAFSPLERLLASRIGRLPDVIPLARPTKILRFHVVSPKAKARVNPKAQPKPVHRQRPIRHRLPRATPSFYVHSTATSVMRERGCRAGQHRAFGIVILAFGKPYYNGHGYGTLTFSNRFASNREITEAMKAFARGYAGCLPKGSRAHIALARGTSNYYTSVPSQFQAGRKWARETVVFARFLRSSGLAGRVASAAAIDAEPAWNPSFTRTRDFFRGYRAYGPGHALYNYGSLDGGVGVYWNARQVWFVTSGMKYARALPEIYYPAMAEQWARMSRIAVRRWGRPVRFAGLMTQHKARCGCGFRPKEAHQALVLALREHPTTWVRRLPALTNIRWD